jgi:hypothetical protein
VPEKEEETAKVMEKGEGWQTSLEDALVDPCDPFAPAAIPVPSGGTVANSPAGSMATGYSILGVDLIDDAI